MEDYAQVFIVALEKLGGKATNKALKEALGWNMAEYIVVKRELAEKGVIKLGRGRGGTVKLVNYQERIGSDDLMALS